MTEQRRIDLAGSVARALAAPVPPGVRAVAATLAVPDEVEAVLFYGSNLRTGALDGVLDFYVLTAGPPERGLWPTVSYRELPVGEHVLRAKIATMRLDTFAAAAGGALIDTTIWTRFVQPAALVFARGVAAERAVRDAVAAAAITAARFAAALGPPAGSAADYWRALFRQTYAAELRVEKPGREEQILVHGGGRYEALLPLAWAADGIDFAADGALLAPRLSPAQRRRTLAAWARRRRWGKPLNVARLVRAAFTFDGAGAYGAWKVERHTGVRVPLTPFRAKHPVLAAPGVLWRVWRAPPGGSGMNVLILAGARPGAVDPAAAYAGVAHKALIALGGETLLARVAGAVRAAGGTRIAVSADHPAVLAEAARLGLDVLPPAAGPSGSVAAGLVALGAPLLVTTADHALLDAAWVRRFVAGVPPAADVAVLLARRDVVEAAAPGTRRTYLRFADGAWSGCNLFLLRTPAAARAIGLWSAVEADRKRPWRIVRRLGPGLLVRYLLGRLSLADAITHLGRRAGVTAATVASPFGLAAVDVDKPGDLDLVRDILSSRAT